VRIYLDCYPCFLRQALSAARHAGGTESQQFEVLRRVLRLLEALPSGKTPPEIGHQVHRIVREVVGAGDPYAEVKTESTRRALQLYPRLKRLVSESADPLDTAVRLSIAGNIIDFAAADHQPDLWQTVQRMLDIPYAIDRLALLRTRLAEADWILFMADNAGETVFDRLLLEVLPTHVRYAVKGGPVLNDATWADAIAAGVDACAEIVDTGSNAPGTILSLCSEEFRRLFAEAPLVIAKGQANYETLSGVSERVFCLLQVKCPVIASDIGVPVGSAVVHQCGTSGSE